MTAPSRACIVLLGDSLTCGQAVPDNFISRFNAVYYNSLDVINRGANGYNTSWYLRLLDRIFTRESGGADTPNVRLVTIWFGANDAHSPDLAPEWGVPVHRFRANLMTMLDLLTSPNSPYALAHSTEPSSIILITPPYIHSPMLDHPGKLDNNHIRQYRDAVLAVAEAWKLEQDGQRWKVGVIDLFGSLERRIKDGGQPERYYTDGLHLSSEGYDVLWAEMASLIHRYFAGRGIDWQTTSDVPPWAPSWAEMIAADEKEASQD